MVQTENTLNVGSTVKQLDQIVPPETMRAAIERGAKVVGETSKEAMLNVEGSVFTYDKASGCLVQTRENPS